MSTRSAIGIKNNDGFITGVYCHFDGYLEHNGRILKEYYNDKNKVEELLSYGDMSSLKENIIPNDDEEHNFENKQRNVCIFYHRDRGEAWEDTAPLRFDTEKEFTDYYDWSAYYYLFDNGQWYWKTKNSEWNKL
jgi:hypothetical protein